jgi:outer membrane protein assembly factor BamB
VTRVLLALALAACAPAAQLSLSGADNDPAAVARALAAARLEPDGPRALAILVGAGELRLVDLASGRARWTVPADVRSRVAIGRTLVALREGDALVARGLADGAPVWRRPLAAGTEIAGLAADADRIVYCARDGRGFHAAAVTAGTEIWRVPATGALGAPAAHGGVVYVPFLRQWLVVLDGASGRLLARLRPPGQNVTWARALDEGVSFGAGAPLAVDAAAPAGRPLPTALPALAPWGLDGFNPTAATYSALDRARLLWRARGPVVELGVRFFFAYDRASGALRWARSMAADVVAAEHDGAAILYVTGDGAIGALDPETGALLAGTEAGGRVLGASFAAEGYRPDGAGTPAATPVQALAAIARDRELRLDGYKAQAVRELGRIGDADAVAALVALVTDAATPAATAHAAAEALLARRDPTVDAPILAALAVHADAVGGTRPRAVDALARALGAARDPAAVGPLLAHLEDPATAEATIDDIAAALVAIGSAEAAPRLASYVLVNRCDPVAAGPTIAALEALLALGSPAGRELATFVAEDAHTSAEVAARARALLEGP